MTHRRWVPRALARRCDVRTKYASHLHPSGGWVVWTFLSNLGENGFFSSLLRTAERRSGDAGLCPTLALSRRRLIVSHIFFAGHGGPHAYMLGP